MGNHIGVLRRNFRNAGYMVLQKKEHGKSYYKLYFEKLFQLLTWQLSKSIM